MENTELIRAKHEQRFLLIVGMSAVAAMFGIVFLIAYLMSLPNNLLTSTQYVTSTLNHRLILPKNFIQARHDVTAALQQEEFTSPLPQRPYIVTSTQNDAVYSFTIGLVGSTSVGCVRYFSATQQWTAHVGGCRDVHFDY